MEKTRGRYKGIYLEMNGSAIVAVEEVDQRSGPNHVWQRNKKGWRSTATSMTGKITGNNTINICLGINILIN